jgi:biotin operon repressor
MTITMMLIIAYSSVAEKGIQDLREVDCPVDKSASKGREVARKL